MLGGNRVFVQNLLNVQFGFFLKQHRLIFYIIRISYAAINRANRGALRFIMKALTLGALISYYIKVVVRNRRLAGVCINSASIHTNVCAMNSGFVSYFPAIAVSVNSAIWTLRFASATVNTCIRDFDCHNCWVWFLGLMFNSSEEIMFHQAFKI